MHEPHKHSLRVIAMNMWRRMIGVALMACINNARNLSATSKINCKNVAEVGTVTFYDNRQLMLRTNVLPCRLHKVSGKRCRPKKSWLDAV